MFIAVTIFLFVRRRRGVNGSFPSPVRLLALGLGGERPCARIERARVQCRNVLNKDERSKKKKTKKKLIAPQARSDFTFPNLPSSVFKSQHLVIFTSAKPTVCSLFSRIFFATSHNFFVCVVFAMFKTSVFKWYLFSFICLILFMFFFFFSNRQGRMTNSDSMNVLIFFCFVWYFFFGFLFH